MWVVPLGLPLGDYPKTLPRVLPKRFPSAKNLHDPLFISLMKKHNVQLFVQKHVSETFSALLRHAERVLRLNQCLHGVIQPLQRTRYWKKIKNFRFPRKHVLLTSPYSADLLRHQKVILSRLRW